MTARISGALHGGFDAGSERAVTPGWAAPWPPPDHHESIGSTTPNSAGDPDAAAIVDAIGSSHVPVITVVCTANICRSPMAALLLQEALGDRAKVRSAGTWPNDLRAPYDAVRVMGQRGLDLTGHRSQLITVEMVNDSALLITMERNHVAHIVSMASDSFVRTYTFPDLVRRAEVTGQRQCGESFDDWLSRVHGERTAGHVMANTVMASTVMSLISEPDVGPGSEDPDEVTDPYGRSRQAFVRCAATLDGLVSRFAAMAWPG